MINKPNMDFNDTVVNKSGNVSLADPENGISIVDITEFLTYKIRKYFILSVTALNSNN